VFTFSFRNSLLSKIISLLRFSEFPVPCLGNFAEKPIAKGLSSNMSGSKLPEFIIFPVFFPVTREFMPETGS
jgi:hypothetical protein